MRPQTFAAAAALSLLLAQALVISPGCQSSRKAEPASFSSLVGTWNLKQVFGHDIPSTPGSRTPNLAIAGDGRVSAFAGVNRISSSLDTPAIPAGTFRLSPMISTRMAGPPEAMKLEADVLNALQQVDSFKLEGKELRLNRGKSTMLRFVKGA